MTELPRVYSHTCPSTKCYLKCKGVTRETAGFDVEVNHGVNEC